MEGQLFSSGKLLLTSEYVVLDGALALAVPTRWGQEFFFEEWDSADSIVYWEAYHEGRLWLSVKIDYQQWKVLDTNLPEAAAFVLKTLKNVQDYSLTKFLGQQSYRLKTNLQFPSHYGLGSSSTLMANLAKWADIDAFTLNEKSLGGSGYDVAVAQVGKPILYQLRPAERMVKTVDYVPAFKDELLFVHLNQKQDSREGIRLYRSKEKSVELINDFTQLTEQVLEANDIEAFSALMEDHEMKLSRFLGLKTTKALHFSDCPVFIKSLGAWGGDFVMTRVFPDYRQYFSEKGFSTIISYDEMVLNDRI